jgi:hypothetical protein
MLTDVAMWKASVPKLAKIVQLLGGFDALEPGGYGYVISLDKERVLRPADCRALEQAGRRERREVMCPDIDGEEHTFLPLHLTKFADGDDYDVVWVELVGMVGPDRFSESRYVFRVPKVGWESGEWGAYGLEVQVPYLGGHYTTADDGDDQAQEIARAASGFDRESIVVALCLRLAEKHHAA